MRLTLPFLVLVPAFALAACQQQSPSNAEPASPALTAAEPAPPVATAPAADWASLDAAVGKYPRDSGLLEKSSVIAEPLRTLLGEQFAAFETNLQTQSPLQRDGGVLYLSGNRDNQGGSEAAYLLIDPAARKLEVGLWQGGKLSTFRSEGAEIAKPADIQTLISNNAGG